MDIKKILKSLFPYTYIVYSNNSMEKMIKDNRQYYEQGQLENRLKVLYRIRTGNELHLDNPLRYTEKIQWRKVNDHNPFFQRLSDKFLVRDWVAERIGEEYLIPILGVWGNFDDIDFSILPDKFVLKTNNASNTNIIVKNKAKLNKRNAKAKVDYWMSMDYAFLAGYEMQYHGIRPRIIVEEFIEDVDGEEDLKDYKFLCFSGKVEYIWVDQGRYHNHTRSVYDRDWKIQPWNQKYNKIADTVARPNNLDEMILLAEKLASGFDHVRVDLYYTGEKILFGEMTFTNGSGFEAIIPDQYDYILGEKWNINDKE